MSLIQRLRDWWSAPQRAVARTVACGFCKKSFSTAGRPKANQNWGEAWWTETYCTEECGDGERKRRGGGQALADAMDSQNDYDH